MSVAMVRDLYEYHRWANRRLFDVAAGLGEEACTREMGAHFSVPTLRKMFAHLYAADANWLQRWKGVSPPGSPFIDVGSMAELRAKQDRLEADQKVFVDALDEAGLGASSSTRTPRDRPSGWRSACCSSTCRTTRRTTAARSPRC